jgi:hypothetical protein
MLVLVTMLCILVSVAKAKDAKKCQAWKMLRSAPKWTKALNLYDIKYYIWYNLVEFGSITEEREGITWREEEKLRNKKMRWQKKKSSRNASVVLQFSPLTLLSSSLVVFHVCFCSSCFNFHVCFSSLTFMSVSLL